MVEEDKKAIYANDEWAVGVYGVDAGPKAQELPNILFYFLNQPLSGRGGNPEIKLILSLQVHPMLASNSSRLLANSLGRRAASTIAPKYSQAVFSAALANSPATLTKVETELNALSNVIKASPELNSFVTNPTLSARDRATGLAALYAKAQGPKKEPVSDITKNLFALLSENGRLAETQSVIEGFNELVSKHKGELKVVISSATPLPTATLSRLETVLKQSQVAQKAKTLKVSNKVRFTALGMLEIRI